MKGNDLAFSFSSLFGLRIPLPPKKLVTEVGGGDFRGTGDEFFGYITDLSKLGG